MEETSDSVICLWEILVPCGFAYDHHLEWDDKVKLIAKGLTILTPTKGKWVSPVGESLDERMVPVRIACSEAQIHDIADMTAKHYKQEAIMYYMISDKVFIRSYACAR